MKVANAKSGFTKTICLGTLALPMLVACVDSAPYIDDESQSDVSTTLESDDAVGTDDAETTDEAAVVLYGQFREHLGGTLFSIEEIGSAEPNAVLIVNDSQYGFEVPGDEETPLWAIGEVRPLDLSQIENVDSEALSVYEGESALYAQRIALVPEPSELTENAAAFYGETLTVYGEVEQIDAENAFVLEDPELFEGRGVLVIQTADVTEEIIPDDAKIAVSGVLRPEGIADLENEYPLSADPALLEALETDYADSPILIADLIVPTNNE